MSLKTVLIVEDVNSLSKALKIKLGKQGYNVLVAQDSYSALEMMKNINIHLILLDLLIPGINGIKLIKKIRKLKISSPVIILSNLTYVQI